MSTNTASKRLGTPPLFDPVEGQIIKEPYGQEEGYWVGAPYVYYDKALNKFFLYFRVRKPRPVRGGEVRIAQSDDGVNFQDILVITKEQLGSDSIERSAFLRCLDEVFRLYISYVDPQSKKWRVDMVEADHPHNFDVSTRQKVFVPEDLGLEGIKDPYVKIIGHKYYMFLSFAEAVAHQTPELQEKMHGTGDIYNTDTTTLPSGVATSIDGIHWQWEGKVLDVSDDGWDRYQARISSILYAPPVFIGFYDGSASAAENYEERCGIAISWDLKNFESVTPKGPAVTSPFHSGSVRYLDVLDMGSEIWYYYEYTREDKAHDLRLAKVPNNA